MPEGDQDHGGVALPPAIALGCFDQLLHLALGQMLARPDVRIGPSGRNRALNCPMLLRAATRSEGLI